MNSTTAKALGLSAVSFALSLTAIVAGSKLYANWLGIRDFRYENQLNMWHSEPTIGFINKPNFLGFSFGNIRVQTNERGFRGTRPSPVARTNGVRRIVGLGDSVMWGTGVNEENSILGFLEKQLNHESSYEVINAGVVGYSTYQELLYLQKHVLPLRPDIVLVNYCENDLLPSEDPFKNARQIHVQYLNQLLESHDLALTPEEKSDIKQLIRLFNSAEHIWHAVNEFRATSPNRFSLTWKVFVLIPIARMAELSREADVRLIYVFIPPQRNHIMYIRIVEQLKRLLAKKGAEFVDMQSALVPDENELAKRGHSHLAWVWPRELKEILGFRNIQTFHRRYKFIDSVHPTEKGNAIIAEHIYRFLTEPTQKKETAART
jgi:lysophospholipase L1-like esterase